MRLALILTAALALGACSLKGYNEARKDYREAKAELAACREAGGDCTEEEEAFKDAERRWNTAQDAASDAGRLVLGGD